MSTFEGLTHSWLAIVTQLAPFTTESILPVMAKSAKSIIESKCKSEGSDIQCDWSREYGEGDRDDAIKAMGTLSAVQNLLISKPMRLECRAK